MVSIDPLHAGRTSANGRLRIAGQVGKVLGERWKALNMKQREPYEAKAKIDKQRYEDEKVSYNNVSVFEQSPSVDCSVTHFGALIQTNDDDEDEE